MPNSTSPYAAWLANALRRFGIPGIVLLAALLCDLLIVITAALDGIASPLVDLVLLPGAIGIAAVTLYARKRPVAAILTGAAVLVLSTGLIWAADGAPYTALLPNLTFTETVAGFELVYFCVRWARPWPAAAGVGTLVATVAVVGFLRSVGSPSDSSELVRGLAFGLLSLAVAIASGLLLRKSRDIGKAGPFDDLVRDQWLLILGFAFLIFLEIDQLSDDGPHTAPMVLCSAVAAGLVVLARYYPLRAGLALAGVMLVSSLATRVLGASDSFPAFTGSRYTQIAAGIAMVVQLVRYLPPMRAGLVIGALSAVVGLGAALNAPGITRPSWLGELAVLALIFLAIAVVAGLYFRSRDTAVRVSVHAAVNDAQVSERMALARELHDVVAHHVTGIVVHAQAAKLIAEKDPGAANGSFDQIAASGSEALAAMRRLVSTMRDGSGTGDLATADLKTDLRKLVSDGSHGVPTELELDLPDDAPPELARSVLRLVQESLTNVGKHASDAAMAYVDVRVSGDELHISVRDNGKRQSPRPAGGSGGYGLVGMRERVELLDGRFAAGPAAEGGWLVEAWLPLTAGEGRA